MQLLGTNLAFLIIIFQTIKLPISKKEQYASLDLLSISVFFLTKAFLLLFLTLGALIQMTVSEDIANHLLTGLKCIAGDCPSNAISNKTLKINF